MGLLWFLRNRKVLFSLFAVAGTKKIGYGKMEQGEMWQMEIFFGVVSQ